MVIPNDFGKDHLPAYIIGPIHSSSCTSARSYARIGGFFIIQILMEYDELFTVNAK
jgi:hypothetical protein